MDQWRIQKIHLVGKGARYVAESQQRTLIVIYIATLREVDPWGLSLDLTL